MNIESMPLKTAADVRRNVVLKEILIGIVLNSVISTAITWGLYRATERIQIFGKDGLAFGFVPGTIVFAVIITLIMTLVTRKRLRHGDIPRFGAGERIPAISRLPKNLVLRVLAVAALAEILLVPASYALLALSGVEEVGFRGALALNIAYFSALTLLITPVVILRAVCDA